MAYIQSWRLGRNCNLLPSVIPESPSLDKPLRLSVTLSSLQCSPLSLSSNTHSHTSTVIHTHAHTLQTLANCALLFSLQDAEENLLDATANIFFLICTGLKYFLLTFETFFCRSLLRQVVWQLLVKLSFELNNIGSLWANKAPDCISNFGSVQLDWNQHFMVRMNNSVK